MRGIGLGAFALCWATAAAAAEPLPSLDLRRFHPPAAHDGSLYLEPAATPGPFAWNVGAWCSYAHRPITLRYADGSGSFDYIAHQLSLDYVGSLGIGERLAIGLTVPSVLHQSGDPMRGILDGEPSRAALGDPAFVAKAALFSPGPLGGTGLAVLGRVTAPVGDGRSGIGEGAPTGELRLLAELDLVVARLGTSAGARVRSSERTFLGERFGHDLPWAFGITVQQKLLGLDAEGRLSYNVEARGALSLTPRFAAGPQSPALVGLSASYLFGDLSALAGLELPLNEAVGVPVLRPVLALRWAPRFRDADGDGVPDELDECPELPEDRDGFEDHDGCPDFDDDDDGVPDDEDRCPDAQEDLDGFEDEDGCPDLDNDGDGIPDVLDACPNEPGPRHRNPKKNGCPPQEPDGGVVGALARLETRDDRPVLVVDGPLVWDAQTDYPALTAASLDTVRAIAQILDAHPRYVVLVGVRPAEATPESEQDALTRAFVIVHALRSATSRDDVAESVGFAAVRHQPEAAARGVGFMVLAPLPGADEGTQAPPVDDGALP